MPRGTKSEYEAIRAPVVGSKRMREFALVDPNGNLIRVGSPPFV